MKNKPSVVTTLFLAAVVVGMSGVAFSEDNDGNGGDKKKFTSFFSRIFDGEKGPGVAPVKNSQYIEECGSCHFPYQPGLLPARSWSKMMVELEDHFKENAELPAEDAKSITDYLVKNAADHSTYKRSKKIMRSLRSSDVPLRASDTPYLIEKHDELTREMVQDNPEVKSISNCDICHTKADTGSFSEDDVRIPGFPWSSH